MAPTDIPDDILQEIVDEFNANSDHDVKLDLKTARRHFNSLPVEFTEDDIGKTMEAISLELLGREINVMVDKGILNASVNANGEFVFWPTPLGKALVEADLSKKEK